MRTSYRISIQGRLLIDMICRQAQFTRRLDVPRHVVANHEDWAIRPAQPAHHLCIIGRVSLRKMKMIVRGYKFELPGVESCPAQAMMCSLARQERIGGNG